MERTYLQYFADYYNEDGCTVHQDQITIHGTFIALMFTQQVLQFSWEMLLLDMHFSSESNVSFPRWFHICTFYYTLNSMQWLWGQKQQPSHMYG